MQVNVNNFIPYVLLMSLFVFHSSFWTLSSHSSSAVGWYRCWLASSSTMTSLFRILLRAYRWADKFLFFQMAFHCGMCNVSLLLWNVIEKQTLVTVVLLIWLFCFLLLKHTFFIIIETERSQNLNWELHLQLTYVSIINNSIVPSLQ